MVKRAAVSRHRYFQGHAEWVSPGVGAVEVWFVQVPHRSIVLTTLVLPVLWMLTSFLAMRRRRRRPGYCQTCGYDLRATPGRCPECGTAVQEAA